MKNMISALVLGFALVSSSFAEDKLCSVWFVSEDSSREIPSEAHSFTNVPAGCYDGRIVQTQTGLSACRVDLSQYGVPSERYGRYYDGKGCKKLAFHRVADEPQRASGPSIYGGKVKKLPDPDHPNGSPFAAPGAGKKAGTGN